MLQINKDLYQVLLKRLEEYRTARHKLVQQLEELDTQARVVQREFNSVAPIGCLPEELLAMVFEAGTHLKHETGLHFAILVSHVTHSWRNIALATPRLWATIRCDEAEDMEDDPYPEPGIERTAAFLARSRSSPVDLHISHLFDGDVQFLHLIRNHFGHCQHLSITDLHSEPLSQALTYFSCQPAPLQLESFELRLAEHSISIRFEEPLFPSGAPRLKIAQIDGIDLSTFHFCLPALHSITSLRLSRYQHPNNDDDDNAFTALRDSLMTLPSLIHLELWASDQWVEEDASQRPIVLPTLHSLLWYNLHPSVLSMIHAASLTVLILQWRWTVETYELHFPSLQHLVLLGVTAQPRSPIMLSQFPRIERLTFKNWPRHQNVLRVHNVLAALGSGTSTHVDGNNGRYTSCSRLHTLALYPATRRC